jgi:hypothetical protein
MSNTQLTTQVNTQQVALGDMERMAVAFAKSGLFGIKTTEQALALMVVAQAENKHPGTVASEYHVIQGRASLKADAMLARFQAAGGRVEWHDHTNEKVSATFSHPSGGALKIDWDMARAKAAGLGSKDNWRSYPRQMLRARVISEGVRAVYPGVLQGMYTPEEVGDFNREPKAAKAEAVESVEVVTSRPVAEMKVVEVVAEPVAKKLRQSTITAEKNERGEDVIVHRDTEQSILGGAEAEPEWARELEKRLFEYEPRVNAFLVSKGQINRGQTFRDMSDADYIARVIANTEKFLAAVVAATANEAVEQKEAA